LRIAKATIRTMKSRPNKLRVRMAILERWL
jgi:hypothetical protein